MRKKETVPLTEEEKRERKLARLIQEQSRELECEAEELANDPRHPGQFRMEMEWEAEHLLVLQSTIADELTRARQAFGQRHVPDPRPDYREWPVMLRPNGRERRFREQDVCEAQAERAEAQVERLHTELEMEEERAHPEVPIAEMSRQALNIRLTELKTEVIALMSSAQADERRAERLRERIGDDEVLIRRKPGSLYRRPSFPPFVAEQGEEWIAAAERIHEKPRLLHDIEDARRSSARRMDTLGACLVEYGFHRLKYVEKSLQDFRKLSQTERDRISFLLRELRQEDLHEEYDLHLRHAPFGQQKPTAPPQPRTRPRPSFRAEDFTGTFVPTSSPAPAPTPTGFPYDRLQAFLVKVRQSIGKELLAIAREFFHIQKELLPELDAELADLQKELQEKPCDMHAHLRPERVPEIVTLRCHAATARA